jgi:hypothetical protein
MAEEQKHPSEPEKENEHWMNSKWRPMMGWMYMAVCTCDFMLFPILWSVLQSISHGSVNTQWQPITLQGAGLFHIAMGAVLGIAAYGRTQEKLGGANNGGISLPSNVGTTYTPPATVQPPATTSSFSNSGFNTTPVPGTAYTPAPSWGTTPIAADPAQVVSGFGGKPAPVIPPFPER